VRDGCDAAFLALHGAMVAEHTDDGEGELLRRVRAAAPRLPIAVGLDFHAHMTSRMIDNATVITGYRTYPHVDMAETAARVRAGSVVGLLAPAPPAGVSAELLALADTRAAQAVERAAPVVRRMLARGTWRGIVGAALSAAVGATLFVAAAPGAGRAAAFWHPLRTLADARAPVRLSVDRATVRRGDSITVTIDVPAASQATLWTRGPGEPWRSGSVALDSAGHGARRIGPLQADLFLRASSGGRTSAEHRVTVALPAFVAELQLTARYPEYLARADEPLVPGADTIAIPQGTAILTNGAASVPVATAAWRHGARPARARLAVQGSRFSGRLEPLASGTWRLDVTTADGGPLEGEAPELRNFFVAAGLAALNLAIAYRRLPEVLAHHAGTVAIEHTLRPFIVVMAGANVFDPFKD